MHEYHRLIEYFWCRKSQIPDLPLREFPEKRSHRHSPFRYSGWVDNRKKISREIYEDRIRSQEASRCFTTNHKFHVGRSMNTGNYDQRFLYQPPSTSEIPTETFF
ncbi:hypothetical protein MIMGU_mgv11b018148mg [Erythranthe guttata]|uniref:Uncharacterized protein n=1 Tax=Erythranthe guttata TaxID=4155 RepID=A0A022RVN3_ERYGU|nr:hypothetical protein MIMGU_mgv11b024153mg [Erythranthe guttata]EYU44021.1 hypothetical protein MIMGU_mgv11b018148mg [Erythranthe guttata]